MYCTDSGVISPYVRIGSASRPTLERPDAESRKLIRWETARRWARIGRAGLRSGSVRLRDVLAARPAHLGLGYAGVETLLWSAAVGAVRRRRAG